MKRHDILSPLPKRLEQVLNFKLYELTSIDEYRIVDPVEQSLWLAGFGIGRLAPFVNASVGV